MVCHVLGGLVVLAPWHGDGCGLPHHPLLRTRHWRNSEGGALPGLGRCGIGCRKAGLGQTCSSARLAVLVCPVPSAGSTS